MTNFCNLLGIQQPHQKESNSEPGRRESLTPEIRAMLLILIAWEVFSFFKQ